MMLLQSRLAHALRSELTTAQLPKLSSSGAKTGSLCASNFRKLLNSKTAAALHAAAYLFSLSAGTHCLAQQEAVATLDPGEDGAVNFVVDGNGTYAYLGTWTSPGKIVQVQLSNMARVKAVPLNNGEDLIWPAAIDNVHGFAYFGTHVGKNTFVKFRLPDLVRVGSVELPLDKSLICAVIDPNAGFAYLGTDASPGPGAIIKIRLSDMTRIGAILLDDNQCLERAFTGVIDPTGGYAYFGNYNGPGKIYRIRLSDFTAAGVLSLNTDEYNITASVIDPAQGYAYFGIEEPGKIVRIRLSDFTRAGATRVSVVPYGAAIDSAAGYAYFSSATRTPEGSGTIARVSLKSFTENATLTLPGRFWFDAAALDVTKKMTYVSVAQGPSKLIRIPFGSWMTSPQDLRVPGQL
jgi:hypothetical protein